MSDNVSPQSYWMSLVSGNWRAAAVAAGWRREEGEERWWLMAPVSSVSRRTWEGGGWWEWRVIWGAVTGGTTIVNLQHKQSVNLLSDCM